MRIFACVFKEGSVEQGPSIQLCYLNKSAVQNTYGGKDCTNVARYIIHTTIPSCPQNLNYLRDILGVAEAVTASSLSKSIVSKSLQVSISENSWTLNNANMQLIESSSSRHERSSKHWTATFYAQGSSRRAALRFIESICTQTSRGRRKFYRMKLQYCHIEWSDVDCCVFVSITSLSQQCMGSRISNKNSTGQYVVHNLSGGT